MLSDEEPGKAKEEPVQLPLFYANRRTVPTSEGRRRSFNMTCLIVKCLLKQSLTTVEMAVASGVSYATCQRFVQSGMKTGLLRIDGFGISERGVKPLRYTINQE